ncbi:hypothetical protein L208DRAFT_1374453 [Tricholoma matsutake]|nr:hypothetical protein L208DRAFT_1374453 [Tricholoma matsutake 945]
MVNTTQTPAKSGDGNTHSPEALRLLARLREIGLNVITGAPNTPNCGSHVSAISTSNPEGIMSFACGTCSKPNLVHITKEMYYVVMAGTSIGIFRDPTLTDSFVTSVKCSVRKKYPSLEAAISTFQAALALNTVKILSKD